MIIESGRVVGIEFDSLWVETEKKSSCSSCAAKSHCGRSLLTSSGAQRISIRVLLGGRDPALYPLGSWVSFGIPEDVVVKGALVAYLLPILGVVLGAWLGLAWFGVESVSALGGIVGLLVGGSLVNWHSCMTRYDRRQQPIIT